MVFKVYSLNELRLLNWIWNSFPLCSRMSMTLLLEQGKSLHPRHIGARYWEYVVWYWERKEDCPNKVESVCWIKMVVSEILTFLAHFWAYFNSSSFSISWFDDVNPKLRRHQKVANIASNKHTNIIHQTKRWKVLVKGTKLSSVKKMQSGQTDPECSGATQFPAAPSREPFEGRGSLRGKAAPGPSRVAPTPVIKQPENSVNSLVLCQYWEWSSRMQAFRCMINLFSRNSSTKNKADKLKQS
jgi:hypothetical protein